MARIREKTLKFPGLNNTYTFADEADLFDANVDCAVGEYRIYNGDLYCCTTAHTGAWDASHFKTVKMGSELSGLKTAAFHNTNFAKLWAQGVILYTNGNDSTSTKRIRTATYIPKSTISFSVADGYRFLLFAYDNTDTYVGVWNGTAFAKAATWLTGGVILYGLGDYNYRIVLALVSDAEITPTAYTNITINSVADISLSVSGASADAKTVGDAMLVGNNDGNLLTSVSNGTNFDDLGIGTYKVLNNATAQSCVNIPEQSPGKLFVVALSGPTRLGQIYIPTTGNFYVRAFDGTTWYAWAKTPKLINPAHGLASDNTAILRGLAGGEVRLDKGTYYIHNLEMPANTTLYGSGNGTVLVLDSEYSTDSAIVMNYGCKIKNCKIVGSGGEDYDATSASTMGSSHGIKISGLAGASESTRARISIENVQICGFTGAGIYMYNNGYSSNDSVAITDSFVHHCAVGLYTKKAEYNKIANVQISQCYHGIINNGGNNTFANCGINSNEIGIYIDGADGTATNNTHGTFTGCTINHNATGGAIVIVGGSGNDVIQNGMIFQGCQIWYGAIDLTRVYGVTFASCNIGHETPINLTNCKVILFDACMFRTASDSPITVSPSGEAATRIIKFINCYTRSAGAVIDV